MEAGDCGPANQMFSLMTLPLPGVIRRSERSWEISGGVTVLSQVVLNGVTLAGFLAPQAPSFPPALTPVPFQQIQFLLC